MKYILFLLPWFWFHEAGHFLMGLFCGDWLYFFYSEGHLWKIPIPRYCWMMSPMMPIHKQFLIYRSGFWLEFLMTIPMAMFGLWIGLFYLAGAILHRFLYPYYGGNLLEIGR